MWKKGNIRNDYALEIIIIITVVLKQVKTFVGGKTFRHEATLREANLGEWQQVYWDLFTNLVMEENSEIQLYLAQFLLELFKFKGFRCRSLPEERQRDMAWSSFITGSNERVSSLSILACMKCWSESAFSVLIGELYYTISFEIFKW